MTTLLGIRANGDDEGVVLFADTKLEYATRNKSRTKIWKSENYAMAVAGNVDKYVEGFWDYLSGKHDFQKFFGFVSGLRKDKLIEEKISALGFPPTTVHERIQSLMSGRGRSKSPIEEAVARYLKEGVTSKNKVDEFLLASFKRAINPTPIEDAITVEYFKEVDILNRYYANRCEEEDEKEDLEDSSEFLLASNKNGSGLYHVSSYGTVWEPLDEEIEYVALGTGAEHVKEYFKGEEFEDDPYVKKRLTDKIKLNDLSISTICILGVAALKYAIPKDKHSASPIEIVPIRPGKPILSHIELLQGNITKAEEEGYDKVFDLEKIEIKKTSESQKEE